MRRFLLVLPLLGAGCASAVVAAPPAPAVGDAGAATTASAPAEAGLPDLALPLRLADLLPLVLARSPAVRAARARLEAAAEKYPQAIALPDPKVSGQYFTKNAMDPKDSFARWSVMVEQDVPFPVTLSLRGDEATKRAEAAALSYDAAVRDAIADLKDVHAERAYLAAAARVQAAVSDVYRRLADVSRGDAASGRTRLPESFRAEALVAQARYEQTVLDELRGVEDQRLRAMLALPAGTPLGEPADDAPAPPLDLDLDALARRALAWNQELRAAGVEVEVSEIGRRMAQWNWAPTFTVGAGRLVNDDYDMASGTRRDSTVVTLGLTVPLWLPAKAAAVREAGANARAARAAESGERERLVAEVARTGFRARNAARLATLYARDLVPQAEAALLRAQSMVASGEESMSSSLELAATWQQLRIAGLRATADAAQSVAALERLLGTSVGAAAGGEEERR